MDAEKVIRGPECHKSGICEERNGVVCPYFRLANNCSRVMMADALILIRQQQDETKRLRAQLDEAMLWR